MNKQKQRVGILTFHRALNYGSVLQAFALRTKIDELGYSAEVIDFSTSTQDEMYARYRTIHGPRDIARNARSLLFRKVLLNKERGFSRFRGEYLNMSQRHYSNMLDGPSLEKNYDTIVVGSDQVWNPACADFSVEYLLSHVDNCRKVAYAPSVNKGILATVPNIGDYLSEFSFLSCREHSGAEQVSALLGGRNVTVALDPTLLIEAAAYRKIERKVSNESPYIFLYSINFRPGVIDFAKRLSNETGLEVRTLYSNSNVLRARKALGSRMVLQKECSPEDFIGLVDDASFVVTNSFHGTAFSVLFQKRFATVYCKVNGETLVDPRMDGLLRAVGLESRIQTEGLFNLSSVIEQDGDGGALEKLRIRKMGSVEYLSRSLR